MIINKLRTCKKNIRIITPYYIPMRQFEKEVIAAARRGVDVEIITAQKRDIPGYKNLKNSYLMRKVIRNGVKVFQIKDKYLHMKALAFDDEYLTFGSFNIDKWSWNNNNEINFCTQEDRLIKQYNSIYAKVKSECDQVTTMTPLKAWQKMKYAFWIWFLDGCNFTMNYRRMQKTAARIEGGDKFYYDKLLAGEVPEEALDGHINLYKRCYYDWDDVFGFD